MRCVDLTKALCVYVSEAAHVSTYTVSNINGEWKGNIIYSKVNAGAV